MNEWIDILYDQFIDEQARLAEQEYHGAKNHDIYEKRLTAPLPNLFESFRLTPHSMYFYYVRINADGRLVIDHYFYVDGDETDPKTWKAIPHDKTGLGELVTKLAINARPIVKNEPREPKPPLIGKGDLKNTIWHHKSYVAIFFDEANWTLRKKPKDGSESVVTFIVREGTKVGRPNNSFFDAIDLDITMPIRRPKSGGPTHDTRSAIAFVNHMKADEAGNELGDEEQDFTFKIIVNVNSETSDDPPTVFIIDPGGTNGGPSVPPPPDPGP